MLGKAIAVTWKAARAGIITGVLLAVARISGETAPLLFTALGNSGWNWDMNKPMASLPAVIYTFATGPYEDQHTLAWAGALLITATLGLALELVSLFGPVLLELREERHPPSSVPAPRAEPIDITPVEVKTPAAVAPPTPASPKRLIRPVRQR